MNYIFRNKDKIKPKQNPFLNCKQNNDKLFDKSKYSMNYTKNILSNIDDNLRQKNLGYLNEDILNIHFQSYNQNKNIAPVFTLLKTTNFYIQPTPFSANTKSEFYTKVKFFF